jgi:lysophospholipid acyltransferase (LPLAT)-like uncharacterized protein
MTKQQFIGLLTYHIANALYRTLKVKIETHADYQPQKQYLFAFWHGRQFLPVFKLKHQHQNKGAVLLSPSKDGDILAVWLKKLGYDVIRGSSRRNNVAALSCMIRGIKEGLSLGLGVDGPIGPIYKVKPGMTYMAQKYQIEIIPVGAAFSRQWIFSKAWDRYEIPKPFSKGACYLGAPLLIGLDENLEQSNLLLEERINDADSKARLLLDTL